MNRNWWMLAAIAVLAVILAGCEPRDVPGGSVNTETNANSNTSDPDPREDGSEEDTSGVESAVCAGRPELNTGLSGTITVDGGCTDSEPPDCTTYPLVNHTISILNSDGTEELVELVTDESGSFCVRLAPGSYRLAVDPEGQQSKVTVPDDGFADLKLFVAPR